MLNVGQLIAERERLEVVLVEATTARADLKALDQFLERFAVKGRLDLREPSTYKRGHHECPECGVVYTAAGSLRSHRVARHGVDEAGSSDPCPDCGKTFRGDRGLQTHRVRAHGYGGAMA